MLEVINLECIRGDRRLFTSLNLTLNKGELLHLHGHNGSGKTTLLRTLCGLIQPSAGSIIWGGEDVREERESFNENLIYIGHLAGVKGDLSALENLQIWATLDECTLDEDAAWNALEHIGLRGFEDIPAKFLSQGQKRRVALARLLYTNSKLWVLDEPFTALDKSAVGLLQSVIQKHIETGGMTILTTHQEVSLTRGEVRVLQLGVGEHGHA
jgi:heme exporter protein A